MKGGLGLINVQERIHTIQTLEFLKADLEKPVTNSLLFEVGLKQKTLCGKMFDWGNSEKAKEIITVICTKTDEINKIIKNKKNCKSEDYPKIYLKISPKIYPKIFQIIHST